MKALAPSLATRIGLTSKDLAEMLPNGRRTKFHDRLHWAKTFMERAVLVAPTRRGFFKATARRACCVKSAAHYR